MDLRLAAVLLLLCTTFTISEGGIPKCCLRTTRRIPNTILSKVDKYDLQTASGSCDIYALVLYLQGKTLCAHPKLEKKLKNIINNKRGKRVPQNLF